MWAGIAGGRARHDPQGTDPTTSCRLQALSEASTLYKPVELSLSVFSGGPPLRHHASLAAFLLAGVALFPQFGLCATIVCSSFHANGSWLSQPVFPSMV